MTTEAVVIGIGNPFRNDDGIGPAVAAQIEEQRLPGVRVVISDGEPAGLLEAWAGADLAVVVDAIHRVPASPGAHPPAHRRPAGNRRHRSQLARARRAGRAAARPGPGTAATAV